MVPSPAPRSLSMAISPEGITSMAEPMPPIVSPSASHASAAMRPAASRRVEGSAPDTVTAADRIRMVQRRFTSEPFMSPLPHPRKGSRCEFSVTIRRATGGATSTQPVRDTALQPAKNGHDWSAFRSRPGPANSPAGVKGRSSLPSVHAGRTTAASIPPIAFAGFFGGLGRGGSGGFVGAGFLQQVGGNFGDEARAALEGLTVAAS